MGKSIAGGGDYASFVIGRHGCNSRHVFKHKIVTEVVPLKGFYEAEAYHQDYAAHHPESPYIQYNDFPKVDHLKKEFPQLWTGK